MKETPFLRVLGSADWLPTKNNDGSSYLLNDCIMIDTGWSAAYNMICHDLDPITPKLLCFTHMHADHYIGLTQLILYWRIKKASFGEWTIAGPKQSVKAAFERAFQYVFHDFKGLIKDEVQMPRIIELSDRESFEAQGYSVSVIASDHSVPGLCYRFTHLETGHSIGFTGDTCYGETFGEFFKGCDLLVHEVTAGAGPLNLDANAISKHSSAQEAAQVAKEAQVKHLLLTHANESRRETAVEAAKSLLDIPVAWALPFSVVEF